MTRYIYGGGGDGEVNTIAGPPFAGVTAQVWSARTGGSIVTDIEDMSGAALSGTVTADSFGQVVFQGPDGYTATLWLAYSSGPRWGIAPKQLDQPNAGGKVIADQRGIDFSGRTFSTKSALPKNTSDPLENALVGVLDPLVIPRFSTATAMNTAFPSPADGDRCYRTDLHARQTYNSGIGRWVPEPTLLYEQLIVGSATNSVAFTGIPQAWNNLRVIVSGRCATSSQTHKWGVEVFAQLDGDSTTADYMCAGWTSLDKIVSGTTTYGISTVDATGGSSTASAPILLTRNGFAGDLGARMGFLPGESTPGLMWGTIETVISNYSNSAHGPGGIQSRSAASVVASTSYSLEADWRAGWAGGGSGSAPIVNMTVALFTGAFFLNGSTIRVYGE